MLLEYTPPLLEEKRYTGINALIADFAHRTRIHRSRAGARFATNYHPMDIVEVQIRNWANQWLEREKLCPGSCAAKVVNAAHIVRVFDAYAHPPKDALELFQSDCIPLDEDVRLKWWF